MTKNEAKIQIFYKIRDISDYLMFLFEEVKEEQFLVDFLEEIDDLINNLNDVIERFDVREARKIINSIKNAFYKVKNFEWFSLYKVDFESNVINDLNLIENYLNEIDFMEAVG